MSEVFKTPTVLREKVCKVFPHDVPSTFEFQIGYLEGNTKRWVVEEGDLRAMYNSFNDGSKITLWCDGRSQSADAGRSEGESVPKTRKLMPRMCHHSVTADDDKVYKKLKASIQIWLILGHAHQQGTIR